MKSVQEKSRGRTLEGGNGMNEIVAESRAEHNFILQQGLAAPQGASCHSLSSALLFQPRVVGPLVILGIFLQSPVYFLVLGAVLWFSALFPRLNPFDAIYNAAHSSRAQTARLQPAKAPRRFSQGMGGTFGLAIGVALYFGASTLAYVLQGFFVAAAAAIAVGKLCLGSFIFYLLRGQGGFAIRTLPWARG
jgi:hypothetical protein